MTRDELKELLGIFSYYLIGGLALGVVAATVAVNGGIVLVRTNYGLPLPTRAVTATVVIVIGALTSVLAFLTLLPTELKLIRRKN